LMLYIVLGI